MLPDGLSSQSKDNRAGRPAMKATLHKDGYLPFSRLGTFKLRDLISLIARVCVCVWERG